jgi:hypothetical protein
MVEQLEGIANHLSSLPFHAIFSSASQHCSVVLSFLTFTEAEESGRWKKCSIV